ncbi:hypothetical protein PC129_g16397 [Phytophthora cactorum]|uniref:Uncharacterized protein n=1 Tax=Phytophthora cactorum TaxID=29920 RepID=A0A329RVK8_9STRA|nr:hypothetical protein Pcac1_g6831 [Phytophthora cactorum]KAG2883752.1 hypothetical protein PC114_g20442 [Phytophthora cactorum]KAG2912062.1 hypothetical protein PC117_g18992 [Phytophthora cactorum]KAG3141030.1 hypothetical protein C6341_g19877 [Phytophthora cactorum]KAG3163353.1 hypothetical protein PC128_g20410 [Phytophthora cactorum]
MLKCLVKLGKQLSEELCVKEAAFITAYNSTANSQRFWGGREALRAAMEENTVDAEHAMHHHTVNAAKRGSPSGETHYDGRGSNGLLDSRSPTIASSGQTRAASTQYQSRRHKITPMHWGESTESPRQVGNNDRPPEPAGQPALILA